MWEFEKCCPECACGMLITWEVETEVVLYLGNVKEVERA